MLNRALKALGKSLLVVTGVGYGVVKALDVLAIEEDVAEAAPHEASPASSGVRHDTAPKSSSDIHDTPASHTLDAALRHLDVRLDGMDERLIRMERNLEVLIAPLSRSGEQHLTRTELSAAIEQLSGRLDAELDRRFEIQNHSVQSLRTMVARTDELLEQVIENIESMRITA